MNRSTRHPSPATRYQSSVTSYRLSVISYQISVIKIVAAVWLFAAGVAQAQTFTVDHFVLSGGGGTSTNGPFSLTGIVGQPVAGTRLAGGPFTVDDGFWSVAVAIQTPGGPLLSISRSGGSLTISWPASSAAFVLEATVSLAVPIAWQPVGQTPVIVGPDNTVTLPASPGSKFYRLRQAPPP